MPEPESDDVSGEKWGAGDWARWAVLDSNTARVPVTLRELVARVEAAVRMAVREAKMTGDTPQNNSGIAVDGDKSPC